MTDEHATQVLFDIKHAEDDLRELFRGPLSQTQNIGYQHLFLFGIANRALSQSVSFRTMIAEQNSMVASSILRLQLDTVLRLYALFWVKDAEAFAKNVFFDKQIDRIKAADGELMKDKYLLNRLLPRNPWITEVYKQCSGFVHFSSRHMMAVIHSDENDKSKAGIVIGQRDYKKSIGYYGNILEAFRHVNMMIPVACADWLSRIERDSTSFELGEMIARKNT